MTCTKTGSKNDLFLNCRRKMKELLKKELSNVAPASKCECRLNIAENFQISFWGENMKTKWELLKKCKICEALTK